MRRILLPFLSLLFLAVGNGVNAQTQTVVDIIVASPDHDTLEQLVIAAELDDDLAGDGPFTVFAPTDSAFSMLPDSVIAYFLDEDNVDSLVTLLSYHVVPDSITTDSFMDGMMLPTLVEDDSLMVGVDSMALVTTDTFTVNGMVIAMANVTASNGVVHIINSILMASMQDTTTTSIRTEPAFARQVSIAPNPASSQMRVNLPFEILNNATLTLRDFNGRTVISRRATSDRESLEVGNLPAGPYLLEIRADAGVIQRKVMVQR